MKLIFKTKEQECDFIKALMKMDKFHIFLMGGIPIWPCRQQVGKDMPEDFYQTYPSVQ